MTGSSFSNIELFWAWVKEASFTPLPVTPESREVVVEVNMVEGRSIGHLGQGCPDCGKVWEDSGVERTLSSIKWEEEVDTQVMFLCHT